MNQKETPTLQEAYDRIGLIEMVYKNVMLIGSVQIMSIMKN